MGSVNQPTVFRIFLNFILFKLYFVELFRRLFLYLPVAGAHDRKTKKERKKRRKETKEAGRRETDDLMAAC